MTKIEAKEKMKYAIAGLERNISDWGIVQNRICMLENIPEDEMTAYFTAQLESDREWIDAIMKDTEKAKKDMMDIIDDIDVHYVGVDGKGGGNDE